MMRAQAKTIRNCCISLFVVAWTLLFHYESLRAFYLNPLFKTQLPKPKFLFPPAGWIMFYQVDDSTGFVDVYGVKNGKAQRIDPHEILQTRTIMFDNIHRNILSTVADERYARPFCGFLERKFPYFDDFLITGVYYPHLMQNRFERWEQVKYRCE